MSAVVNYKLKRISLAMLKLRKQLQMPTAVAGVGVYNRLSVCLSVFPHDISKRNCRITKLDIRNVPRRVLETKPFYFWVKRSKIKVTSHKNTACVGLCTLVSDGMF